MKRFLKTTVSMVALCMVICALMAGCGNNDKRHVDKSNNAVESTVKDMDDMGSNYFSEDKASMIQEQLDKAKESYAEFDFDSVGKCYDELDKLGYDTTELRKEYEYDSSVYDDAYNFYSEMVDVKSKAETNSYSSLVDILDELRLVSKKFDELNGNKESEIGKYISEVQSNVMYSRMKSDVLVLNDATFSDRFLANGYAKLLSMQLEKLLDIKCPFTSDNADKTSEQDNTVELPEIMSAIREQAKDLLETTTTVHVDPYFGNQYYAFETTDSYMNNTSESGKKCTIQARCFQRLEEMNTMFDFAIKYADRLGYDILKVCITNDIDKLEIVQPDIINAMPEYYVVELSTERNSTEELIESAVKLVKMASSENDVCLKIIGAEEEDIIVLSSEQKESLKYVASIWMSILNQYQ